MSSVDNEYYEYLMSQDKSTLAITIMNLETSSSNNRIAESIKENDQLKQQLAENQKKKEDFKTMYFNKCLDYEHLHEKFDDKCAEFELKEYNYKQTIFEKDQDKILFAIEQLEKVKNYMITDEKDMFGANYLMNSSYVLEFIDNQIKQLKEGK